MPRRILEISAWRRGGGGSLLEGRVGVVGL